MITVAGPSWDLTKLPYLSCLRMVLLSITIVVQSFSFCKLIIFYFIDDWSTYTQSSIKYILVLSRKEVISLADIIGIGEFSLYSYFTKVITLTLK